MKTSLVRAIVLLAAVSFFGTILDQASTAYANTSPVLLTINDSNPSAVTITATDLNPIVDATGNTANDGVDLLQFFSADEFGNLFGQDLTGTLTASGVSVPFNDVNVDDYSAGGGTPYVDLELYVDTGSPGATDTETFSTGSSAFTGTWTIDFSSLGIDGSALPAAGSGGNILSGNFGNPGAVIGSWEVASAVPEPSTVGSLILGGVALGALMYRRRAKLQG